MPLSSQPLSTMAAGNLYYNDLVRAVTPINDINNGLIPWLRANGLIRQDRDCTTPLCQQNGPIAMVLQEKRNDSAGFIWRCPGCRTTKSLRAGTFFENVHLTIDKVVCLVYLWAMNDVSQVTARQLIGIGSDRTMVDWFQFCRDLCENHLRRNPRVIGGPGMTVEIDESLVARAKPAGNGQARQVPQLWVFGGFCRETRLGFIVEVPDRSAATLLPLIQHHVLPGSTVLSDEWRAYNRIQPQLGLQHRTVNHSLHFVDPVTGVHTNNVENMWHNAKRKLQRMSGTRRPMLASYFAEFCWHQTVDRATAFQSALEMIRLEYPQ